VDGVAQISRDATPRRWPVSSARSSAWPPRGRRAAVWTARAGLLSRSRERFGVTHEELKQAVRRVGPMAEDVRRDLGK
jgi:hypothetical protein